MSIIKVPPGQTDESFINCKIENVERLLDLYKLVSEDSGCFDIITSQKILQIEYELVDLLKLFNLFKGEI